MIVEYAGNVYDPSYGFELGASEVTSGNPVDTYKENFMDRLKSTGAIEPHNDGRQVYIPS